MHNINAQQVKAARALLNWKQEDLAVAAKLGLTSIRSFELGCIPRVRTTNAIRHAFEKAGIEFIDGDGVKRHIPEIKIFKGMDGCDKFVDHMQQTLGTNNTDVIAVVQSHDILAQLNGNARRNSFQKLGSIGANTEIKLLISDALLPVDSVPLFPARVIPRYAMGPSTCFVYGSHYAYIVSKERHDFLIVSFDIACVSYSYRKHFLFLWDNASPLAKKISA